MKLRFLLVLFVWGWVVSTGYAQGSRADTASRTSSAFAATRAAQTAEMPVAADDQVEFDLGEQIPVSAESGGIGAYLIGEASLNYTSNAFLTNGGNQGDMFFVGSGGVGFHPHIVEGLYLDAYVYEQVFQYARYSSLNFSRFNAGGGFDYVFEGLGQLTAYVRYDYERFLDGGSLSEFFVNNAITTGLAKEFSLNDSMTIQTGAQAAISVAAEPIEARRNEYDLWVGWRWRILDPLELQTYYMVSLFDYTSDDRLDVTQNVGATLNLAITRWARLSASAGFVANSSTEDVFDYTAVNLGGTIGLDIRF